MRQPFEALREQLIRAGYAPGRVGRYVRELTEHYADLVAEAQAAGKGLPEAQAVARARIGSDEQLAAAMLMRPALRTLTAKAPVAVVVVAPMALLSLAGVATVLGLMSSLGAHPGALPQAFQNQVRSMIGFENFQLPVLVGALIGLWAARNRLPAHLAVLGVLGVALVSAALRISILWPGHDPADPARWAIAILPSRFVPMWMQRFQEVGLLDLAVGLAVFWAASGGRGPVTTRTWTDRAAWATLVLAPVALMALGDLVLSSILAALQGSPPDKPGRLLWLYGTLHLLPALTSIGVLIAAARQRAAVIWPALGLLAVAGAGAGLRLTGDPTPWVLSVIARPDAVSDWLQRFSEIAPFYLVVGMTLYLAVRFGSAPPPRPARA